MKNIKMAIIDFLLWCGCISLINAIWVSIEVAIYGVPVPSQEDTLIGMLFSTFLWFEVRRWLKEAEHG